MIVAIAVGGCLVVFAAIAVMVVWLRRSYDAGEQESLARLHQEMPQRGWTFEERNDSYAALYNELPTLPYLGPTDPLVPDPKAVGVRNIVTGQHRGRAFIAAEFDVYTHLQAMTNVHRCIWVCTPAPRPGLVVKKVFGPQNSINRAIGWDYQKFGDPDFDHRFEVTTDNDRFAQDVLHTRMIRFLLDEQRQFQQFWLVGDVIDVAHPVGDHRDPAELIPALDLRCDILDLVPRNVWA